MNLRRFLILLLGLSIPFNNVALFPSFSVGMLMSAIYVFAMFPLMSSWRTIGQYYGNFLWNIPLYMVVLYIVNNLNYCGYNTPLFPLTMFLCFVLMVVLLIHGLYDKKALSFCMYGIAFGGILMSVFYYLNIGVEFDSGMRLSMFGENSNALGIYMCISAIIILYMMIFKDELNIGKCKYLLIFLFIPVVFLLVATASRTAFISFCLSIIVVILFYNVESIYSRFIFLAISLACCIYAINFLENTDAVVIDRLTLTLDEGNSSGREEILESLLPYVTESPIWGCGETGYVVIAQKALTRISIIHNVIYGFSPHNVIIELLLYTGVMGLSLWLIFWWKLGKESWVLLRRKHLLMPVLACVPMLACILSGQLLTAKWAFIMYAYIMTEYYYYEPTKHNL